MYRTRKLSCESLESKCLLAISLDATTVDAFGGNGFEIPFDGFIPENFTPFGNSLFVTAQSDQLGETNLGGHYARRIQFGECPTIRLDARRSSCVFRTL